MRPLLWSVLLSAGAGTTCFAGEGEIVLPPIKGGELVILLVVLASAIFSVGFGWWLRTQTTALSPGNAAMQEVGGAIQQGAYAYLKRQIATMIWLVIALTVGLYFMYKPVYADDPSLSLGIALSFFLGVAASYCAGLAGMDMAVKGNMRTANQALTSFKGALECAFRAGAVSGMFTVGLGLLGAVIIFLIYRENAMKVLVGFGFGGSLAALFMRVGGGIFTKAADVGADIVGKVEAGIPEDDPRNPATIADNVGDNVGDCAGMAADVFESYEVTLVAAIILGAATVPLFGEGSSFVTKLIMYALLVRSVGVVASAVGILSVKGSEDADLDPMQPINFGFVVSAIVATIGFGLVSLFYMNNIVVQVESPLGYASREVPVEWWRFFLATFVGIALAMIIGRLTEYFTSTEKKPVTEIAYSSRTGPATMIISGFSYGLESSVWSVLAIAGALFAPLIIFPPPLFGSTLLSFYGIALAGLGLLTTTGYILAMDTFGPISDNANGIFEMSGALKEQEEKGEATGVLSGEKIVSRLDSVGNTTKALTKGFAIATAVLAATALFHSFVEDAKLTDVGLPINLPEIFIGLLIGGAAPYLFSSFAINAVGRSAFELIEEVRRQFREKPGIMEGTEKPDYATCVSIVTAAAQKELLGPGILAIALPVLVGFGMSIGGQVVQIGGKSFILTGAQALGGYLAGAILSGQLMAVLLANSGGAWDNAKKKIEDGLFGGKGTEYHKAAVVCDTVGDPFKDTAGPALNPLIKVMNLVAILIAPIVIQASITTGTRIIIVMVALGALALAVMFSKRGSLVDTMELSEANLTG